MMLPDPPSLPAAARPAPRNYARSTIIEETSREEKDLQQISAEGPPCHWYGAPESVVYAEIRRRLEREGRVRTR